MKERLMNRIENDQRNMDELKCGCDSNRIKRVCTVVV